MINFFPTRDSAE